MARLTGRTMRRLWHLVRQTRATSNGPEALSTVAQRCADMASSMFADARIMNGKAWTTEARFRLHLRLTEEALRLWNLSDSLRPVVAEAVTY